ncbi:MAG: family 20 glycosylhydrolase [Saprospiraceae bacterium]|nr:family 20 glycosylhydrolase [Saprospiraceae bacterium]HMW37769.1 family 20 glycosylhydrolase [Saprospiraceae bacterium]HMX87455.1 family 20 glycosylhydrolase [Saprospiraceae bacterium]HMZ39666.1 family 20 glycosylhydrolase [Saprospiraceae bacterium]HNA63550.1 family 20 glycosylhydrolase [Saprospiraceae bacterium]
MNFARILSLLFITVLGYICGAHSQGQHSVIPQPVSIRSAPGNLKISDISEIIIPAKQTEFRFVAQQFIDELGLTKCKIKESKKPAQGKHRSIVIIPLQGDRKTDYYSINVSKSGILITAVDDAGAFYALQTLLQLKESGQIPFYVIEDYARFQYRGMHLDVSRHFFPVTFIKTYIDLLARYKFNYFHWHLTDDQGWRIEIRKFPDLTEIGSRRKETLVGAYGSSPEQYDHTEYGGYYTQDEIREVVEYAQSKHVEIIPEIEMPGHSAALLASYPQFGCGDGPYQVATTWGVTNNVICPTDTSLWFMKEILSEVCDLFPGKYVHIGGDEVNKDDWKKSTECTKIMRRQNLKTYEDVQSYFIRQIDAYLSSKGKILIGWDEILEGGLSQNAVVMSWRGLDGGIQAAKQKHKVIFTPGSHCYFDHYQSLSPMEPLAIGGYTTLEKVYSFDPIPSNLPSEYHRFVLGAQGNVWTEYISTPEQVLYMSFPRAIALSEVNWSQPANKDYVQFVRRLNQHISWFDAQHLNYSGSYYDLDYKTLPSPEGVLLKLIKAPLTGKILLETSSPEEGLHQQYLSSDSLLLGSSQEFKVWYQLQDNRLSRSLPIRYTHHKLSGKKIQFVQDPSSKYSSGGPIAVINGIDAPSNKFSGPEWLGFDAGRNMDATIDLAKTDTLHELSIQFFQEESSWIYLPQSVEIFTAGEDKNFISLTKSLVGIRPGRGIIHKIIFPSPAVCRYLRILVNNYGQIESDKPGAGHGAWLFTGEISAH